MTKPREAYQYDDKYRYSTAEILVEEKIVTDDLKRFFANNVQLRTLASNLLGAPSEEKLKKGAIPAYEQLQKILLEQSNLEQGTQEHTELCLHYSDAIERSLARLHMMTKNRSEEAKKDYARRRAFERILNKKIIN